MTEHERDRSNQIERETGLAEQAAANEAAASGRRRFLRGSAAGSIVALSVLGKPAWASNCSYSGRMSGNLSAQTEEPCGGEGYSPGYWKTHYADWHPNWPPEASFYSAFGVDAFPGSTLGEVIWGKTGLRAPDHGTKQYVNSLTQLGFQSVAALQNAANPVSYVLTVAEVIESFRKAYYTGDPKQMEVTKNSFDKLNNLSA
jgi:hypothetical protein